MEIIYLLIPLSIILVGVIIWVFHLGHPFGSVR